HVAARSASVGMAGPKPADAAATRAETIVTVLFEPTPRANVEVATRHAPGPETGRGRPAETHFTVLSHPPPPAKGEGATGHAAGPEAGRERPADPAGRRPPRRWSG